VTDTHEAPQFAAEAVREGTVARIIATGELDYATTPDFQAAFDGLEPGYETLIVDLSGCTFFASSGITLLLEQNARAEEQEIELVVIKAPPEVQRMFDLLSLGDRLTFRDPE
jgi:anti-anti-sigma factor